MFPLMIKSWRDAWRQGNFSFYWVQLADFRPEPDEPAESDWAELREAQTMALSLPNTGQAVIIDIGEANDIHPRNKEDVGERLARWALAKDYGIDVACRSPEFKSMKVDGNKVVITLDYVGGGVKPFDVSEVRGFTIAGEDKKFVEARAKVIAKDQVQVWSDAVTTPVAVRYAWANNPVCNLRTTVGLPVTPFRTDDWPGVTVDAK
jgi:sialate O-acetylesterase